MKVENTAENKEINPLGVFSNIFKCSLLTQAALGIEMEILF